MKTITIKQVEFKIDCLPEDSRIEGNASAIDEKTDKKIVKYIKEQLDRGNMWAWCTIRVAARYKGIEGSDYLGGCSYRSEKDFIKNSGYYQDMKQTAYDNLIASLELFQDEN